MKWFKNLNRRTRQIMAGVLSICLMLTMMPVSSLKTWAATLADSVSIGNEITLDAAKPYYVNGVAAASGTLGEDGCTAYLDTTSGTLTFKDFSTTGRVSAGNKNLTVVLQGTNTIATSDEYGLGDGFDAGNITISGDGVLNVSAKDRAISTIGTVTVNSGTVVANADGIGIVGASGVIINGGNVTGIGGNQYGIDCYAQYDGIITINGGNVIASSSGGSAFGKAVKVTQAYEYRTANTGGYTSASADIAASSRTGMYYEIKVGAEPEQLSIYPYATAMTQSSSTGSMTLAVDTDGSSYQWQVSDTKDGTFEDAVGGTNEMYTFDTIDGKWYRCVIDGNKITKPVQVLNVNNNNFSGHAYSWYWYLSNDSLAYALKNKEFDIVGKYNDRWIETSYNYYWDVDARSSATPDVLGRDDFSVEGVEKLKITFNPDNERKAIIAIDLEEGYQAASVGTDTQLYGYDDCPLTAKETRTGTLKQIQMVGADSLEVATASSPAFVIKPITEVSSYWIGFWSFRQGYCYNDGTISAKDGEYTFNQAGTHVMQFNGDDSGMTMSWTNVPSGGVVKFEMSIGTVQQTGAILQDPVTDTDTMELVVTPGSYYRLLDENGVPATDWVLPNSEGNIVFDHLTPDTLYTIETVSPENYNEGNPDEGDIEWLDEVYTKIPIDDTTTDDHDVHITPYCISARFGNLNFEKYTYTVSSGTTPITVPSTGLVTGLSLSTTYTLYAQDKVTHNTSTAATFTTIDHSYEVTVKQDIPATLVATCDGESCNDSHELTITAPTRTEYDDSGSASATLSQTTFAGQTTLPAIKYVGRAGTNYGENTTAPTNAGKYTASITVEGKTASVDYEIAKATPTGITWPSGLSTDAGEKLSSVDLSSYATDDGSFAWKNDDTIVVYSDTAEYPMTYTPNNSNYQSVEQDIEVEGIDDVKPTGKISIGTNYWNNFLNTVTFGFFFKETKTVTITAEDNAFGSGIDEIAYCIANQKVDDIEGLATSAWTEYDEFDINPEKKYVIYARIIDKAGNVTYLHTDGIVVFKDTEVKTGEYDYTLTTKTDIVTNINLGNNTVDYIDICEPGGGAGDTLNFTVNAAGYLVLDGSSIEAFAKDWYAGDYEVAVSYKALDEEYIEGTSKGDKISDTVLTLHVKRCRITKPSADSTVFTYTGSAQVYHIPANVAYEVTNNIRTKAGGQEVTVALKDINTYEWADGTTDNLKFNFSIGKATPSTNFPTGLTIGTDKKLSDIDLTGYEGYTWDNDNTTVAYGSHDYPMTFTPTDTVNYNTVKQNVTVIGNDVTAPTGEITITGNKWNEFWNNVTFGLFFKETQMVTVTSGDTESGVAKTEYFLSDKELSENEAKAITDWTAFSSSFDIDPNNQYVVYVRVTDNAGNAAIINSDGVVLDNILPVLAGIENGKTYYQEVEVTVTDANLDKVEVNGDKVTVTDGKFKLMADDEIQKVKAFDKAGNVSAEITVTVEAQHTQGESPKTGDLNSMWIWALCCGISMATVKGVLTYKRNKKRIRY